MTPGAGEASSRTSFAAEAVGVATAVVEPAVGVELATPAVSLALVGALASGGLADSPSPEHAVAIHIMIKRVDICLTVALPIEGPVCRPLYGSDYYWYEN
jgi:hypothetical protein